MTKRQKSIRDAYFAKSRDTDSSTSDNIISVHSPSTNQAQVQALWKEQWALQFKWIDYSAFVLCRIRNSPFFGIMIDESVPLDILLCLPQL